MGLVKITLEEHFKDLQVRNGIIVITNDQLYNLEYDNLNPLVKEAVYYTFHNQPHYQIRNKRSRSVFSRKVSLLDIEDPYFIIFFDIEGEELVFEKDDEIMFLTISNIVNQYLLMIELESAYDQIAGTVE